MFQSLIGRLQTIADRVFPIVPVEFQSLIGRLQTRLRRELKAVDASKFQSLIGRLQTAEKPKKRRKKEGVSIPHR